ncbi:MAG: N-6 DNA methylase [Tepidisphaeraceae bacterium]|jgi:hypothetical protein
MTRRELYRAVAELLPRAGGAAGLLDAAGREMRRLRGLPAANASIPLDDWRELLEQDDALGQIYQAINAPMLEEAYRATARQGRKFTSDEIPAVTQLFTPKWVVEFLLHNTLGRLWRDMHPDTRLRWRWLVKSEAAPQPPRRAIDLRICDPACGTMNFGMVAIDMLRQIYREEGCVKPDEIDEAIVRHNLIGFDIDPTAIALARQSLEIKIGRKIGEDQLRVADALFDKSPIGPFDVVVTNPPYLSARNLDAAVVREMKKEFPSAWRDAYACFIFKSLQWLRGGGRAGILCMHSFMFTATFEKLRRQLAQRASVETAAHFGPGLFEVGNPGTLQTVAMVLRQGAPDGRAVFFRLVDADDKQSALAEAIGTNSARRRFEISPSELAAAPRSAWMYWISPAARRVFREYPKLAEIAPPRQGLATTDNAQFVRYWWEVEEPGFAGPRKKWIPYAKGGGFARWYQAPRHRLNWEEDGRQIKQSIIARYPYLQGQWRWVAKNSAWYGRAGLTYSYLTSGRFSARVLEAGTFFDVAGSALFPADPLPILGILNSTAARELLGAINPTVNFQVGDLALLPVPPALPDELRDDVQLAIDLARQLDRGNETSPIFSQPTAPAEAQAMWSRLAEVEGRIDRTVGRLYGLGCDHAAAPAVDRADLARRWISYALGTFLGRWGEGRGTVARLAPLDQQLALAIRGILSQGVGSGMAREMESMVGGLERFLSRDFLPWHNRLYRGRPVIWGFAGEGRILAVLGASADAQLVQRALRCVGGELPKGWRRWPDDGIAINLCPLTDWIADRKLQAALRTIAADLRQGRFAFSRTSRWMRRGTLRPGSTGGGAAVRWGWHRDSSAPPPIGR